MKGKGEQALARRERQVMDLLYREGEATAKEVQERMEQAPSYSAVRALLATLEQKGLVRHRKEGRQYVYQPQGKAEEARQSAVRRLLSTFFEGRPENLVASLLDPSERKLDQEELDRIKALLAEQEGGAR